MNACQPILLLVFVLKFDFTAKNGCILFGKLKTGKTCLCLCNCEIEGFYPIESAYLAKLFKEAQIQHVIAITEAGRNNIISSTLQLQQTLKNLKLEKSFLLKTISTEVGPRLWILECPKRQLILITKT
jgi:hypothetical protein